LFEQVEDEIGRGGRTDGHRQANGKRKYLWVLFDP
jgi:hypothetical protein